LGNNEMSLKAVPESSAMTLADSSSAIALDSVQRPRIHSAPREPWTGAIARLLIYLQIICQLVLLSGAGSDSSLRPIVRSASFAGSILLLALVPRIKRLPSHPATKPALAVMAIIAVALFLPDTPNLFAGTAHAIMYLAILSPIFWVPRLKFDARDLRKLFLIIWVYYSLSSAVGVLQFAYPGSFQPELSSAITAQPQDYIDSLMIETSEGEMVFRPMGLTDSPGGAAVAGFYAVLIGFGLFLTTRSIWMKLLCVLTIGLGMTCLYICQVRSVLIEAMLCLIVLLVVLIRKGRLVQVVTLVAAATLVIGGSFLVAYDLGGETITNRLATLTEDDPAEVYYKNRGIFLEYTINELVPQIPWGAGLGRWGTMNTYFGDLRDSIYVEIQWTGWLVDGGIPLIIAYSLALLAALRFAWKTAMSKDERFWIWGAVMLSYNIAAVATTFNYPFFMSQTGLELWLLNAALFAAAQFNRQIERAPQNRSIS
jgi:hypothetical protein